MNVDKVLRVSTLAGYFVNQHYRVRIYSQWSILLMVGKDADAINRSLRSGLTIVGRLEL